MNNKISVGDMVETIKAHEISPRGEINGVLRMKKEQCGCIIVDIGKAIDTNVPLLEIHCQCGKITTRPNDGIWWMHISRFKLVDPLMLQIDAILKEEVNKPVKEIV